MSPSSAKSTGATDREFATRPTSHGSGGNGKVAHLSVAERTALGKAARAEGATGGHPFEMTIVRSRSAIIVHF